MFKEESESMMNFKLESVKISQKEIRKDERVSES